jgi:serine/alanine adding enzyme
MDWSASPVQITTNTSPGHDWDAFVSNARGASLYHGSAWVQIPRAVFGQEAFFLEARASGGQLVGVLPLVRQHGPLFGSYMTSLPYFNYGSVLAETEEAALQLMDAARSLATRLKCRYLELRDTVRHECAWPVRTDKVSMLLELPADGDALGKQLGAKLRSQIRRPDREGVEVCVDAPGSLDAFYDVFCRNMHALGTPVYPRRFFQTLRDTFPAHCSLVVLQQGGLPQAGGFLLMHGNIAEIPWAACREDAKRRGYNMKLYWECLLHAMARGCRQFDFGRSTAGSGTYQFKAQWGALPKQLFWYRWESRVPDPAARSDGEGRLEELVARTWSRLPLSVANRVGPMISPRLPW